MSDHKERIAVYLTLTDEQLETIGWGGVALYRDVAQAFIDGASIEKSLKSHHRDWEMCRAPRFDESNFEYRVAIKYQDINGVQCEAPISEKPSGGDSIFYLCPTNLYGWSEGYWEGNLGQTRMLQRGQYYRSKEAIFTVVRALGWDTK